MHTVLRTGFAGLAILAAAELGAQSTSAPRRFQVTPSVGVMQWDNTSGLANKQADASGAFNNTKITPTMGVTAIYNFLRQTGIGFYFEAARPTTRGDYFPPLLLKFGDNAQLKTVSQRLTTMIYGVQGQVGFSAGRLSPYASAGFGAITVLGDPQQNNDNAQFTNKSAQFGGGLSFGIGGGAFTVDVRDYVFFDWNRERLNVVSPGVQNRQLPSVNPAPPAAKKTVNNIRVALGFSFVPRFTGAGDGNEDQE